MEHPLYAAQVHPETGAIIRAYFFLGAVPDAVLNAAQSNNNYEWPAAAASVLRKHYGPAWKSLLTAEPPPSEDYVGDNAAKRASSFFYTGGNEFDVFDNIGDAVISSNPDGFTSTARKQKVKWGEFRAAPAIYSDIATLPEDTIMDLRNKIKVVSGVSTYRQHLFYYINEEGPVLPYRFTLDGAPVVIDWQNIKKNPEPSIIAGISVDMRLEDRRENIKVEAMDTFTTLSLTKTINVSRVYFVDLYTVIPPIGAPDRPHDNLATILADKFQFDLLYYGGLIRYWPQLSSDAMMIALSNPTGVAATYPKLESDTATLQTMFGLERTYALQSLAWRPSEFKNNRQNIAVTVATVKVLSSSMRIKVAIRNVFDWIATSNVITTMVARFDTITAVKRHISSYSRNSASTIDWFLAKVPRRDSVTFAIIRNIDIKNASYIFLTVHADGKYEATSDWREDDRISFDLVKKEIAHAVRDIITRINAMGSSALPIGGILGNTADAATLGAITVSTFWPHALTTDEFKEMKTQFKEYERAGLITVKGLQQSGAYAFYFRKGITAYDLHSIEHLPNQYGWMTDTTIFARWSILFQGRIVRIFHRATDLRIEISGADNLGEFELIQRYILSFLDSMTLEVHAKVDIVKKLRKLQERDPVLFDLKKYDPDATVYSVLCQSGRQPTVYSEAEYAQLKNKKSITKYWNFTEKAPAYYACPHPSYPHLNLRAGDHPLGYCMPCCKKTKPNTGSNIARINAQCLRDHSADSKDSVLSRHTLTYGKDIPIGRISDLNVEVSDGLFLDVCQDGYKLFMVGVQQSTNSVANAGFAFSLAHALTTIDKTPHDIIKEFAEVVLTMPDTFESLGGGAGAMFKSAQEMYDAIINSFTSDKEVFSPFGAGGIASSAWQELLIELARYTYDIETVLLVDQGGGISIEATPETTAIILNRATTPRLVIIATTPSGTYPVYMLDPNLYLRVPIDDRWMACRRTFCIATPNDPDYIPDRVAALIYEVIESQHTRVVAFDLNVVGEYLQKGKFKLETRLINMHNMCYGVILLSPAGEPAYIPVKLSAYQVDGNKALFGARPDIIMEKSVLDRAIADINNVLGEVIKEKTKVILDKKIVGFISVDGLHFHHAGIAAGSAAGVVITYDTREIDNAIYNHMNAPMASELGDRANDEHRLYQLFLAEFSTLLKADRDESMRKKLKGIIKATNFESASSVTELRDQIIALLPADDLQTIRAIISRAFITAPADIAGSVYTSMDATNFTFDRITMSALLNSKTVKADLRRLMATRIVVAPIRHAENMFVSCSDPTTGEMKSHCVDDRLAIPKDKIDGFYDILAADVQNPSKHSLLAAISAGIFDSMEFIRRPNEQLQITQLRATNL